MIKEKNKNMLFVHYTIGIAFMFGFQFIPPIEPLTPFGINILGIFIGLAYLWSTTDGIWASLLSFIAIALSGYMPFTEVLSKAMGNNTVLLIFFSLTLFGSAMSCGIIPYMANFFLTLKIIEGRPIMFTFIIMLATYVVTALTDIIPAIILFWAIVYSILEKVGYKKGDQYSTLLVMAVFFGGCLGTALMPFKGAILISIGAFESVSGTEIDYLSYMMINFITAMVVMVVYCLMIKYVFRADMRKIATINVDMAKNKHLDPMNTVQKINLGFIILFIVGVLLPSILPAGVPGIAFLKNIDAVGVAIVLIILLLMIRLDGKPILIFKDVVHSGVPWNVIFMVAAAVFIAGILKLPETGILPFFKIVLNPILGTSNELVFAFMIFLAGGLLTALFHNGVLANLLVPIIFTFASTSDFNAAAIAIVMTMVINMVAFLTPAASVYAPLLHGNSEWIKMKDIMTYGVAFMILTIVCCLFISLPIAKILF